ncbi:MAG: sugar ABC transporter substrate-binding protein [Limnochordaceae bacterium]|nr:sugar ABC transporter substrate-binding protein [Limnochordaceae bacterium]
MRQARKGLFTLFTLVVLLAWAGGNGWQALAATEPVRLRVAVWGTPADYQEIVDAFKKANPGVDVRLEPSGWGEYWSRLQTQIAGGVAPDVVRMSGAYLGDFAADGALVPLDSWIARDKVDLSQYFNTGDIFRYAGHIYGLPEYGDIMGIYYNIDRFEQRGVPAPSDRWQWSDLAAAAKKLTVYKADGTVQQWGLLLDLFIGGNGQTSWVNFLLQNGTRALDETKTRALFDQPAAIEAIQFLADLYQKDHSIPSYPEVDFTFQSFTDEKAAMMYAIVPIGIPYIGQNARFRWDIGPMARQKRMASETNFVGFAITRGAKNPELAWKFVQFVAGPVGQAVIARKRAGLPALKAAAFSAEFLVPEKAPRRLAEVLQATTPYTYDLQFTPGWSEWTLAADQQVTQAVLGTVSVQQAMRTATEKVNAILARARGAKK